MKTAVVYRTVKPDHVCPFGLKALDLLERLYRRYQWCVGIQSRLYRQA